MKKSIFFALFYLLSNSMFGQDFMSFGDCLDLALKNNLALKSAVVLGEIADNEYKSSYGKLLPSVSATVENKKSWGKEIDPDTNIFANKKTENYSGNVGASYNLFAGFSTINFIKSAKQDVKINKANIQKIENEIKILQIKLDSIKENPNNSPKWINSIVTISGIEASGLKRINYFVVQYPDGVIKSVN